MSQAENQSRRSGVGLGCLLSIVAGGFLFVLLMGGIGFGVMGLLVSLLFGWISFLTKTAPKISWDGGTICLYVLIIGCLVFLADNFFKWLVRSISVARGRNFFWPLKWTCAGVIATGLCMLIGMAVTGIAHQMVWLLESDEPMYEQRPRSLQALRDEDGLAQVIRQMLIDTHTVAGLIQDLAKEVERPQGQGFSLEHALEISHVLCLAEDGKIQGALIFPRQPDAQRLGGYHIYGDRQKRLSSEQVQAFIQQNRANLIALY